MNKKIVSTVLVLLITVPLLFGCKSTGRSRSGGEYNTNGDEISEYVKTLADGSDFEGVTFTFIGKDDDKYSNYPVKDEETGEISSDALYYRQRDLEDVFGIVWDPVKTVDGDETGDKVISEVAAGGDSYDLAHGSILTVGQFLLNAGVIRSTDDLTRVDLDNEWWIDGLRDYYSVSGRLFFLTGPIMVNNYLDSACVLFNKDVTAMYGIDDSGLYDSVRDGTWTVDRMFEIVGAVPVNTGGPDGGGTWRYFCPSGVNFLFSSGFKITEFDDDGNPYVPDKLPKEWSDLADKICPAFSDESQTVFVNIRRGERNETKYGTDKLEEYFIDGRALFDFTVTLGAINLRSYDVKFGILPMPKLDVNQKQYRSFAAVGYDSAVYLPKSLKDLDLTDTVTEAMGALGEKYIKSAYYEKLLKGQSVFDSESMDMLDVIFSSKVYDMASLFDNGSMNGFGDFLNTVEYGLVYDNSAFASSYNGMSRVANAMAKNLVKTVNKAD